MSVARPEADLLDGAFYAGDPHPAFAWMRRHEPVFRSESPLGRVWGITRHADVLAVSRDPATFCSAGSSRPDAPAVPSMINLDDPAHLRRRSLVNRGFTPRRVAAHEPFVRRTCRRLIEAARERGRFDFVREIAAPLPMILIGELLGVPPDDHDRLLRWSDDLIVGSSASARPEQRAAAAAAFAEYAAYHADVVAERRARPRDDLLSTLLAAEIDGERLHDEALLQESLLLLVGGDETTRHVLSGGMLALLEHPDQRDTLARRPDAIAGAVEEMLRWVTPIQNMARTLTRDVELRGRKLRGGDKVLLLYGSANRDEEQFPDAQRFDACRSPNEHVAFGHGTHFCLGASLARLELRVMFEELLPALPSLRRDGEEPLRRRPSNFIVGLEALPVRLD